MTLTNQRDSAHCIASCLAKKGEIGRFKRVNHVLLRNWLGISLFMGGGEWLTMHHLVWFHTIVES